LSLCNLIAAASRLDFKKRCYICHCSGDAIGRQRIEERLAVAFLPDSGVEQDQDAAVFEGADEAAEALFERDDR